MGLWQTPRQASGVHLVQPEAVCLLGAPSLLRSLGSQAGVGVPCPPIILLKHFAWFPDGRCHMGSMPRGENGPDLQRRGGVRRLGLSPHGSVGKVWLGGCSVCGTLRTGRGYMGHWPPCTLLPSSASRLPSTHRYPGKSTSPASSRPPAPSAGPVPKSSQCREGCPESGVTAHSVLRPG